jgi:hypothetical protein
MPSGTLIFDNSGNLYGAAVGEYSQITGAVTGSVFELSPTISPGGSWTESVLWDVDANNEDKGSRPTGQLAMNPAGNIDGIDAVGGGGADRPGKSRSSASRLDTAALILTL